MASPRPRPFLDTNVLFSGWYRPGAAPGTILRMHASGQLDAIISELVLVELVRTFGRKAPHLLTPFQAAFETRPFEVWPDPPQTSVDRYRALLPTADAVILAAVLESGADCLVTGNTRDFTAQVATSAGIEILGPTAFVQRALPTPEV